MVQINNSFLRSKFARRIFVLFLLSAVVPVVVIALLSYDHISGQLNKQSYEQSRIVCKAIGMDLYRRLTLAHGELADLGKNLSKQSEVGEYLAAGVPDGIAPDFEELTLVDTNGEQFYLRGKLDQQQALTDEQRRQITKGKTVLQTQSIRENHSNILFIQTLGNHGAENGLLIGKVNPEFIWAVSDLLPPASDFLILGPTGQIMHSSNPSLRAMLPRLNSLLETSISGHLEWASDGEKNHASYWSVFTQDLFSSSNLVVVVSQPGSIALRPIDSFKEIYVPMLLLAILCISFITAKQIRKKLIPLITLKHATQRIASGDFSGRVDIVSDDEFAVLGEAFNAMAGHLETQFTSLSTMAEIDRLILSSFDVRFIITTVLGRAGELTPCSTAAVLHFDGEDMNSGSLSIRRDMAETDIKEARVRLTNDELSQLLNNPSRLQYSIVSYCPSYLIAFIGDGTQEILLFPTFTKKRLSSVLIFGYSDRAPSSEEDWSSLRKFADHVAVALSNAGWEERLYHQAHYDSLTNLPNRALLKDRLDQAIARAKRNHSFVGLLFLDLDRFKLVNDSLGHAAGDAVLKKVAAVLTDQVRSIDTVVRFGGDEFVIIIPDIDSHNDSVFELGTIAKKIFKATHDELQVDRQIVHPKMSIGIALYPKDGIAPEELIKNADAAMYHAKNKGRARYEFFAPELNAVASHRLQLEQDLRRALEKNEFHLNYQAKIDCHNGHLQGAEALIRWHHPARGLVSPLEFIGIAEETGLIREIGEWVIGEVCRQIMTWRRTGLGTPTIAVNVSPQQFQEHQFTAVVSKILEQHQLEPEVLELEITETTVMSDAEESIAKLLACQKMGLSIAMDDFGTGYSSLSYLRRLPIDTLKIDQSFISNINEEEDTRAIVEATILLAHKLGFKVVAEGVETVEQRQLLQEMQCDAIQGYLISKPLSAEQFAKRFLEAITDEEAVDPHSPVTLRNAAS